MGTIARPQSEEAECWCFKCFSPSREESRSTAGMIVSAARNVEWYVDVWTPRKPQTMRQYRGDRESQMNQKGSVSKARFFLRWVHEYDRGFGVG
jgi:hypothetical protein